MKSEKKEKKGGKKVIAEASRDYTINLHKRLHKVTFKKKAVRAVREIVAFTKRNMLTEDVRVDTKLNQFLWSNGIRNVPKKVRVRIQRRKNEDDDSKGNFYCLVQHVPVDSFENLRTENSKVKK